VRFAEYTKKHSAQVIVHDMDATYCNDIGEGTHNAPPWSVSNFPARRNDEVEGELMKIVSSLGLPLVTYVIVSCKMIFIRL
jgi:hypothetical protein